MSDAPQITLKARIKVTSRYTGKSKFNFWTRLEPNDVIQLSTRISPIGRGSHSGLYATTIVFDLIKPEAELRAVADTYGSGALKFSDSMTNAVRYLEKLQYEVIEDC